MGSETRASRTRVGREHVYDAAHDCATQQPKQWRHDHQELRVAFRNEYWYRKYHTEDSSADANEPKI